MSDPESKYSIGEAARKQVAAMLKLVAFEVRPCKACGRTIYMIPMAASAKNAPFTDDAVSHFSDCPRAADFKGKRA